MVFRTTTDGHDAIWIVAELDRRAHRVVYYRTEPERLVARVEVACHDLGEQRTKAAVVYSYIGLSDAGNADIAAWSDSSYTAKMMQWEESINGRLAASR
jgi:hypothetical protein